MIRIPINNVLTGNDYTMTLSVGSGAVPVNVLLDTGSSMLAVDGGIYDPSKDGTAVTTQLLQKAEFVSGSFLASVVRTTVGLPSAAEPAALPGANLAVTYDSRPGTFGQADGIFGLAYAALDTALKMPANTWKNRYSTDQLKLGQQADLDPYMTQAAAAGLFGNKFAFAVQRSAVSMATDDPASDPVNAGLFIPGGGAECADLYTGAFASVAVVHEQYYNTNLLAVQIGDQSLNVPAAAPGSKVGSNSIIDSGSGNITLDQGLYDKILALFNTLNPDFALALEQSASGCDQTKIDLSRWPPLRLVFQGSEASQVSITIPPSDYWQFDSTAKGTATLAMVGDGGMLGGQSILGLPVFGSHFVVFDRTATNGHGAISFAARR
jgi:hypothetical protein